MDLITLAGYLGAIIAGVGYIPQITHLIKEHCSAGISIRAFGLWLVSSVLIMVTAVSAHQMVFIFLQIVQLLAAVIIITLTKRYVNSFCPSHLPSVETPQPEAAPPEQAAPQPATS